MKHESIEKATGLLGVLIAITVSVGGIAEAAPSEKTLEFSGLSGLNGREAQCFCCAHVSTLLSCRFHI